MYYIQSTIPALITIKPKENISSLTGEVLSCQYYLSIEDYQSLNLTINSIIDTLNSIDFYTSLDLSTVSGLSNGVQNLIKDYFVNISYLNGVAIIDNPDYRTINVLDEFTINNRKYYINDENEGNIELPGNYISGKPEDYVQSFNGRNGDVTGAIEQIKMNREIQQMIDGVVNLTGLTSKDRYVERVNGRFDNIWLVSGVTYNSITTLANSTNSGNLSIESSYFRQNEDNNIPNSLKLQNVDETNDNTAITYLYLTNYFTQQNPLIRTQTITTPTLTLPINYYPLHFYDSNGNWLRDVTWKLNGRTLTIENRNEDVAICTIMKVDE